MHDIRSEIKEAFARRIDAAPMSPDLAVRVAEHVSRRPQEKQLRFATAVAVLLATGTVGTLLYLLTASHRQPQPAATPPPVVTTSPTPSETPAPTPSATATATPPPGPRITTLRLQDSTNPAGLVWGPDGALWLAMQNGFAQAGGIERLNAGGTETRYALPAGVTGANGITLGPDGALWIAASGAGGQGQQGVILRLTTRGSFTTYALTSTRSDAYRITAGPDGALWFTEEYGNRIGRITTSGLVTEYALPTVPTGAQCGQRCPLGITAGPDGALWFTESQFSAGGGNKIGRITVQGAITEYPLPTRDALPGDIVQGPDGNLWFTEERGAHVGRITPGGQITEFPLPGAAAGATTAFVTAGLDGAVWFTGTPARADVGTIDRLYRVTTDGTFSELRLPGNAGSVAAGGGALWVAGQGQIWRVELQ